MNNAFREMESEELLVIEGGGEKAYQLGKLVGAIIHDVWTLKNFFGL